MPRKWLAVILVLLAIAGFVLIQRDNWAEQIRQSLQSAASEALNLPVKIGGISLEFFPATVVLEDLSIQREAEPSTSLARAHELRATISLISLLTETVIVHDILVQGLELHHDHPAGTDELRELIKRPKPESVPGKKRKIVIRRIELRNGTVELLIAHPPVSARFAQLSSIVLPDLEMNQFEIEVHARQVDVETEGWQGSFVRPLARVMARPGAVEIRNLSAGLGQGVLAASGQIETGESPVVRMKIQSSIPLEVARFGPIRDLPVEGRSQFDGELIWQDQRLSLFGDLSVADLTLRGERLGKVVATVGLKEGQLSLTGLEAQSGRGLVKGNATIQLNQTPAEYEIDMALSNLMVPQLASIFKAVTARARPELEEMHRHQIDGRVNLSGRGLNRNGLSGSAALNLKTVASPIASTPSKAADSAWARILRELTQAEAVLEINTGVLHLTRLSVAMPQTEFALSGSVSRQDDLDLIVRFKTSEIAEWAEPLAGLGTTGRFELAGSIQGAASTPVFDGAASGETLRLRGVSIDTLDGHVRFGDQRISFDSVTMVSGQAQYRFDGEVSFESQGPKPSFDFVTEIDHGSPHDVVALFWKPIPVTTPATGTLAVAGHPKAFRVEGDLRLGPGEIYGQEIDGGWLNLVVTEDRVQFNSARGVLGRTVAAGDGEIRFNGEFAFASVWPSADSLNFPFLAQHVPDLEVTVSGELDGDGRFENPNLRATLAFQSAVYRGLAIGFGSATAKLADRSLDFELTLSNGLSAEGMVQLRGDFPIELLVTMNDFDGSPLARLVSEAASDKVGLRLSGVYTLRGPIRDPNALRQRLLLNDLSLDLAGYEITNQGDIDLAIDGRRVQFDLLRLKGTGTTIAVTGEMDINNELALYINGEADLDLFRLFTREFTYGRGTAYLALNVFDSWSHPKIRGGLTIQDGLLRSESIGQSIHVKTMNLAFNEKHVLLEALEGELGGGQALITGRLDLDGLQITHYGLNFELTGSRITTAKGLSGVVDASLFFQGSQAATSLQGEVLLRRFRYDQRIEWKSWILEFLDRERRTSEPIPVIGDTTLNLQIFGKQNILIDNNLAKIPLAVDLAVRGTINQPVILGRIEAVGGTFTFRRNDFKISSASVDFIDPEKTRPILDISAKTRVRQLSSGREFEIDMMLSGTVEQFDLDFTSNPVLGDRTEILALLTTGRTASELAQASGQAGTTEGVGILTGPVAEVLEERVQELTGIDRFQVDPAYSSSRSSGVPQIKASKRLFEDRVIVTYATTFDPTQPDIVEIEYVIGPNVSLVGRQDERGVGSDLKFRFEFR